MVEGLAVASRGGELTGPVSVGEWWGDRSILDGCPSRVDIVALTPMVVLVLDGRRFRDLPRRFPVVAARIMADLASRPAPYELAPLTSPSARQA